MPAGTARAFARAVMAARRQPLEARRQRILESAAGHAERTEYPVAHEVGERNPDCVGESQLLNQGATTGIMGGSEGRPNQSHWTDIRRRLAVEYLQHRWQRRSGI